MPLPHITNSTAGINKYDPVNKCLFEVYFTLPPALQAEFQKDELELSQQVISISGLGAIDKAPDFETQKFMGTDRSFINPKLGDTFHEISVEFNLNLRNETDNYIYKLFKAWNNLAYDQQTGTIVLKKDYCAEFLKVSVANRVGDVYHEVVYKDVMGVMEDNGMNDLSYTENGLATLKFKFRSDWFREVDV